MILTSLFRGGKRVRGIGTCGVAWGAEWDLERVLWDTEFVYLREYTSLSSAACSWCLCLPLSTNTTVQCQIRRGHPCLESSDTDWASSSQLLLGGSCGASTGSVIRQLSSFFFCEILQKRGCLVLHVTPKFCSSNRIF